MFDLKTTALVGAAVAAPWLADKLVGVARGAGVAIPVYVTAGQRAALAAFPSSVAGVSTIPGGDELADSSQMFARWNTWNKTILASQGPAKLTLYSVAAWNPTNYAALTADQANAFATALLAAVDAGRIGDEAYTLNTPVSTGSNNTVGAWLGADAQALYDSSAPTTALGDAYNALKIAQASLFTFDFLDTSHIIPAILALVNEMDGQGYLVTGKPFIPTLAGGLAAAGAATEKFITGVAGDAIGAAAGAAVNLLLSAPVLLAVIAIVVIGPGKLIGAAKAAL